MIFVGIHDSLYDKKVLAAMMGIIENGHISKAIISAHSV